MHHGQDASYLRAHPGEVFGYLAHAHPFLEGNGRTILTIFAELTGRSGFHVEWESIDKAQFLLTLTRELLGPGKAIMDGLVLPYARDGILSAEIAARRLRANFTPTMCRFIPALSVPPSQSHYCGKPLLTTSTRKVTLPIFCPSASAYQLRFCHVSLCDAAGVIVS